MGLVRLGFALACLTLVACENSAQPPAGERVARRLGTVDVTSLDEISGLAASRQNRAVVWVHGDGGIEEVHAVDATSGKLLASIALGQELDDCEDMALGAGLDGAADYLYLADVGDNDEERDHVQVVRLAEPTLTPGKRIDGPAQNVQRLRLTYPDGKHDAEALLVVPESGDALIVTKEKGRAGVYRAAAAQWGTDAAVELEHVLTLGIEQVSGGDISRDGKWIVLRREEVGWLWRRHDGQTVAEALRGPAARIVVRGQLQDDNGEAIAFHADGSGYYTISEGKRQPIYLFPLP